MGRDSEYKTREVIFIGKQTADSEAVFFDYAETYKITDKTCTAKRFTTNVNTVTYTFNIQCWMICNKTEMCRHHTE
jgi:hypothetical protein